ncbi:MAG: alpha/beta fold hydrolase [Anaerolineae bacterium]|nr:alpha/beta fold hydrolase [Anaerolineae bacterium]
MRSSVKFTLLSVVILIAAALSVSIRPVGAQTNDPEAIALALLDNMVAGDFEAATENFDATMQSLLPADTLAANWDSVLASVGSYQSIVAQQTNQQDGSTIIVFTLQFEKALLDLQTTIDPDGLVSGLYIRPASASAPPPYEPPAYANTDAFEEHDVTIGAGTEWALPGTLTLPVGDGPFPAVVLVHGSGPNDRDESGGALKPFRDIAWGLASQGIAVLRYDKRTLVHGQAMVEQGDYTVNEETVDDALLAAALLRETDTIDPDKIFILGHSQGGYMTPRIGQRDPALAGLIIMAGNSRPLTTLIPEQIEYLLELDGDWSTDDQAQLDALQSAIDITLNAQPGDDPGTLLFNAPAAYWVDLNAYDPAATIQTVTMPVLVLQGERDYQVTMTDFQGWQVGRENMTFISYPTLNHLFTSGEGPSTPAEYDQPGNVAEDVINDITSWILAH